MSGSDLSTVNVVIDVENLRRRLEQQIKQSLGASVIKLDVGPSFIDLVQDVTKEKLKDHSSTIQQVIDDTIAQTINGSAFADAIAAQLVAGVDKTLFNHLARNVFRVVNLSDMKSDIKQLVHQAVVKLNATASGRIAAVLNDQEQMVVQAAALNLQLATKLSCFNEEQQGVLLSALNILTDAQ